MNPIKTLAPRLTYRVRYGYWCDHLDTRYMPLTDGMESVVWRGWSEWEMWDLGRDKIRHCRRCEYTQTLSGPPLRTALREWWGHRTDLQRALIGTLLWSIVGAAPGLLSIVSKPLAYIAGSIALACLAWGLLTIDRRKPGR